MSSVLFAFDQLDVGRHDTSFRICRSTGLLLANSKELKVLLINNLLPTGVVGISSGWSGCSHALTTGNPVIECGLLLLRAAKIFEFLFVCEQSTGTAFAVT